MSILTTVGLIGIGYMVKDRIDRGSKYYDSYRANTIKAYLRNLAMDKMDDIFYKKPGTRNNTHTTNDPVKKPFTFDGYYSIPVTTTATSRLKYEPKYPYKLEEAHYDDIEDALAVIEDMQRLIDRYGFTTVSDYLNLIESDTFRNFEYTAWGWKDLSDDIDNYIADDINIETGEKFYTIDLPEPVRVP